MPGLPQGYIIMFLPVPYLIDPQVKSWFWKSPETIPNHYRQKEGLRTGRPALGESNPSHRYLCAPRQDVGSRGYLVAEAVVPEEIQSYSGKESHHTISEMQGRAKSSSQHCNDCSDLMGSLHQPVDLLARASTHRGHAEETQWSIVRGQN